jgi:hypothetical protein
MTGEKRYRAEARGDIPNFKRFHLSFRSRFRVKRRWYSSLGESINPSNIWSVILRITGRKKKIEKPSPLASVETFYTEKAAQVASFSNDHLIFRTSVDELSAMDPPDSNPFSFDSISEKITDEIIERAIFKPSTESSTCANGIPAGVLQSVWFVSPCRDILCPWLCSIVLEVRYYQSTAQAQFSRLSPHLSSEPSGQDNRALSYVASERRYPTPPQPTSLSTRNLCNRCC